MEGQDQRPFFGRPAEHLLPGRDGLLRHVIDFRIPIWMFYVEGVKSHVRQVEQVIPTGRQVYSHVAYGVTRRWHGRDAWDDLLLAPCHS